ncbi:ferric iron ABC transporter ATP-binding protein [Vibrio astriarenae]|nr:ferric iron ABC transporter ATP-binding protein [Vibrio sp. C7]
MFATRLGNIEAKAQDDITVGARCELLLRPQHVVITPSEESQIEVIEQQFMGDHCRYVIDIDGHRLLATSPQPLVRGQSVSVEVDMQGILAYYAK